MENIHLEIIVFTPILKSFSQKILEGRIVSDRILHIKNDLREIIFEVMG
jgi:hypothetical protein